MSYFLSVEDLERGLAQYQALSHEGDFVHGLYLLVQPHDRFLVQKHIDIFPQGTSYLVGPRLIAYISQPSFILIGAYGSTLYVANKDHEGDDG